MFLSPTIEKPSENLCFSLLEPMEPLGAPMATPWEYTAPWDPGPLTWVPVIDPLIHHTIAPPSNLDCSSEQSALMPLRA